MKFPVFLLPAFFIILVFVVALPAVITMIYLQVYKRYVNRVLDMGKKRAVMAPPYRVVIILTVAALFVGVMVSLFAGYQLARGYYEDDVGEFSALDLQAFYAQVQEVGEHTITVKGISVNEERYRGEFRYEVWGETSVVRKDEPIELSELERGDLVSIILITGSNAPADVLKIQLIEPVL